MFFPIRDDNPTRSVPIVTYLLIVLNLGVYVWGWLNESRGVFWLAAWYGLVPRRLLSDWPGELFTVVSSMFMHGGLYHLASNMWFLHLFGDNVEDTLGRARYLAFYLLCGVAAALAQVLIEPESAVPMIGASGAIGGVVGGYLMLYPRARILAFNMVPLLWLVMGVLVVLPAWMIGLLFLGQNLLLALENAVGFGSGGVAFAAHLGGFLFGVVFIRAMALGRPLQRQSFSLPHRRRTPPGSRRSR